MQGGHWSRQYPLVSYPTDSSKAVINALYFLFYFSLVDELLCENLMHSFNLFTKWSPSKNRRGEVHSNGLEWEQTSAANFLIEVPRLLLLLRILKEHHWQMKIFYSEYFRKIFQIISHWTILSKVHISNVKWFYLVFSKERFSWQLEKLVTCKFFHCTQHFLKYWTFFRTQFWAIRFLCSHPAL